MTDLLVKTGKIGCKPISTSMDPNHKLGEAKEEPMVDKRMYQKLVGRLISLAHTRLDITYAVSVISQFMHDPREPHLQAAHRVMHCLKGNPRKGILFKKNEPMVDKRMYQRLVGRLIYLAHTRLDIAYAVSVISQFMHDPREPHLQAAHKVMHYLKGNPRKGILFKKNDAFSLEAYTDADYAGSIVDRRSTTRYCTFLEGNLVTWKSKKHNVVAWSSGELEFRVIAQGLCELLWLKIILDE